MCSQTEGIIPALEPSHALYHTMELAKSMGKGKDVLVSIALMVCDVVAVALQLTALALQLTALALQLTTACFV
jgi:tryptophan synthase beta subunit